VTATPNSLRVSRIIGADAATLFRAWTDAETLMHWWRQEGDGWGFAGASIDLRVGGAYRLSMTGPDGKTHTAIGVYQEIVRPIRLVFTWDWEDPSVRVGDTLVTVEFKERGGEETEVVVTHDRFPDASRMGRHEQGWTELLTLLSRTVGVRPQIGARDDDHRHR